MLAQLTISNFAIVRELEIDFNSGMTAITGETGAGKSIAIDALGLCLGGRADGDMVRAGASRADLCARFSLKDTPAALRWLEQNQLEDGRECLLRRVLNSDGRSRGFINGTAVPLSQLRELGQLLIQIHGQHAHQQLIKPDQQKSLLDGYAGESDLMQLMAAHYRQWHQSCRELALHQQQSQERAARAELLAYQLKELNEFSPQPGEFEQIDEEYKRLANSGQLLSTGQQALTLLADGEEVNLQSQLYSVRQLVTELAGMDSKVSGMLDMLEEAKPVTSCATTASVLISILTVCLSWNSVFRAKFPWRVSTTFRRKSCRTSTSPCWTSKISSTIKPTRWKPFLWPSACIISRLSKPLRSYTMFVSVTLRNSVSTSQRACICCRCRMVFSPLM